MEYILLFQRAIDFLEHYSRLSLSIAPTRFVLVPRPLSRNKQPILLPSSSGVKVLLHPFSGMDAQEFNASQAAWSHAPCKTKCPQLFSGPNMIFQMSLLFCA